MASIAASQDEAEGEQHLGPYCSPEAGSQTVKVSVMCPTLNDLKMNEGE
jgi:hypothetical protein